MPAEESHLTWNVQPSCDGRASIQHSSRPKNSCLSLTCKLIGKDKRACRISLCEDNYRIQKMPIDNSRKVQCSFSFTSLTFGYLEHDDIGTPATASAANLQGKICTSTTELIQPSNYIFEVEPSMMCFHNTLSKAPLQLLSISECTQQS